MRRADEKKVLRQLFLLIKCVSKLEAITKF